MTGDFGRYVEKKRKKIGLTLRGLANELEIAPAFMSDIEKGHRYPPGKEKLFLMAKSLHLNEEETYELFDLAGKERENAISPDLPEYIMNTDKARVALRTARNKSFGDKEWMKIIEMIENYEKEKI